jgi:hypothetical protein
VVICTREARSWATAIPSTPITDTKRKNVPKYTAIQTKSQRTAHFMKWSERIVAESGAVTAASGTVARRIRRI